MKRLFARLNRAFSLIEVTIALGIAAFCLVSILGLFSIGIQADRTTRENTSLALASETLLSYLRANGFTAVVSDAFPTQFYFDSKGNLQLNLDGSPINTANTETQYIATLIKGGASANLLPLTINLAWPAVAASAQRQQFQILTSIVKYD